MELFKNFKDLWRGVALALVISVPAWLLGKQFEVIGGPVFAILIGMRRDGPRPDPNGMGRALGERGRAPEWARPRPRRERR